MLKRVVIFVILLLFYSTAVDAVSASTSGSAPTITVSISDGSDVYGYEVNLSIDSGSVSSVADGTYLVDSDTYGDNQKNGYLYVYGSKLAAGASGVNGSGTVATVTTSSGAGLTLKGLTIIDSTGAVSYTSYNTGSGAVASTTTASSSGGGSSVPGEKVIFFSPGLNVLAIPSELSVNVIAGKPEVREIIIVNNEANTVNLDILLQALSDVVTLSEKSITLLPGQRKTINLQILANGKGLTAGKVVIKSGDLGIDVPVIINVQSKDFLFDSSITLAARAIKMGGNLIAQINLLQVGPAVELDVVANYIIKDFEGNIYLEESETFSVLESKDFVKEFDTNVLHEGIPLPPGKYVLGLEIVYPGAFAVSSAQFEILGEKESPLSLFSFDEPILLIFGIGVGILVLVLVIVIVWVLRRRVSTRGRKRKK